MNADQLRERMENLQIFIEDAEAGLRNGTVSDLAGLDREIAQLCSRAVALPPEQARDLQPLIAGLIGGLERLGEALKDFRDEAGGRQ